MTRSELKQGSFYLWNTIIVECIKIWTDRKAYVEPTQVCTVKVVFNPLNKGCGRHIYKIDDKVVIDNWKDELFQSETNEGKRIFLIRIFEN